MKTMINTSGQVETGEHRHRLLENLPWLKIFLFLVFSLALFIRLNNIHAPGHLIDREYHAAIFARAFYFENNSNVEAWRKDIALITKNQQLTLEPPLDEYLVSLVYRIMGREDISYARYLNSLFWLVGGIFLFRFTQRLLGTNGAVFATGYYLFIPMGIIISRSFQPDSLMMMLFLISLYSILLYFEYPSTNRLLLSSALAGITILIRPLILFALFCVFIALSIDKKKHWRGFIDKPVIIFSTLSLIIPILYYGYEIFISGAMRAQVQLSFLPHLLLEWRFWKGWFDLGSGVIGFSALIAAIIGFFLLPNNRVRTLAIGLAISYIAFGVVFTYHIHTHPYYHIQLIPLIGICAAPIFIQVADMFKKLPLRTRGAASIAVLLITLYFGVREVNKSFIARYEAPNIAREIGEIVHHSPRVVFVSFYYGQALEYYGEFGGAPWPVPIEDSFYRRPGEKERSIEERIGTLGFVPEYFVITHFDIYNRLHPDLKVYLEENCSLDAKTEQYLVYSHCGKYVSGNSDTNMQ